jgi:hypothetical protein
MNRRAFKSRKESTMADEPRRKDPEPPAEPVHIDDTDPAAGSRNEPADETPPEVVDDDRFQATDN